MAETRECENDESGNDLLNSFKYANFTIDEEKDLAMFSSQEDSQPRPDPAEQNNHSQDETKSSPCHKIDIEWSAIIPEEQLQLIKEEERLKTLEEMRLMPRPRPNFDMAEDSSEAEGDDADGGDGKKGKKRGTKANASIKSAKRKKVEHGAKKNEKKSLQDADGMRDNALTPSSSKVQVA